MEQKRFRIATLFFALAMFMQAAAQVPRPHLDALRQQLRLSANLELEWLPNANGLDTLHVIDDFNRASTGPDWLLDERFWGIENFELVLNDTSPSEWRYLALFKPIFNTVNRKIHSVSYRWGVQADSVGIGEGSFALLINKRSYKGDAYWLWRRTNQTSVWLYAIKNGTWEYYPGQSKEYDRTDANLPIPKAGDVITATMRNEVHSMFFDYYINDHFDATVQDTSKEFAQQDTSYFGLFMHGQNLNNMIDDFTVTWLVADTVPPAGVTDLRASDSSTSSITLTWTSPGDNYWDGQAKVFDLRYATFPITPTNFSLATPAANLPAPAPSGAQQQFTINALQSNTTYFFALRFYDEANHASSLSNVVQSTTAAARVATSLQLLGGCDQIGRVGATLLQPLVVLVKDQFDAPFAGYVVNFTVKSGEASFANGGTDFSMSTDSNGVAATEVRLGATTGEIEIEITATGLSNSPLICRATATFGAPADLLQLSGNLQLVSAGRQVAPLVVRVTDAYGNSVVALPALFAIIGGGGRFLEGAVSYSTQTALNGTASAELFAGADAGDTTTIAVTVSDSLSGAHLQTHFVIFSAAADSLLAVSGDGQTAPIGTQLGAPLVVRVVDVFDVPVKNFLVNFKIVAGGGVLGNDSLHATVATDSSGIAATTWKLGLIPGMNQVAVEASGLKGSPITFNAIGEGVSSVAEHAIALPKEFALLQNSPNPFSVNGLSGNATTAIHFALPEPAEVRLVLFDVNGRVVRSLMNAALHAGSHHVRWHGRDANGRALQSGVYFYRMQAVGKFSNTSFVATRKLVLAK